MLGICLIEIFDMDLDTFVVEHIYFVFFDNALCCRQSDREDTYYFVDSPIRFGHDRK